MADSQVVRKKVLTVDHLFALASDGKRVTCDHVSYMNPPIKAISIVKLSGWGLSNLVSKGMWYIADADEKPDEVYDVATSSIQDIVRNHIRRLGMTQVSIALKVGVKQQRVAEFMRKGCTSETLDKYIKAFMPELYKMAESVGKGS